MKKWYKVFFVLEDRTKIAEETLIQLQELKKESNDHTTAES